jgi:hypothetical protein
MDRIQHSMDIQILLLEDVSACGSVQTLPARHCGDEIRGSLKVVTCEDFDFEIGLFFEGALSV